MNNISLSGRLTRDPELRSLPSGDAVCQIRLAVDNMAPGRKTGYIDVVCFGKPGEAAARVLTKGWLVGVDGRLEHRTWEAKDGAKHEGYQVIGSVEFYARPRTTTEDAPANESPDDEEAAA